MFAGSKVVRVVPSARDKPYVVADRNLQDVEKVPELSIVSWTEWVVCAAVAVIVNGSGRRDLHEPQKSTLRQSS